MNKLSKSIDWSCILGVPIVTKREASEQIANSDQYYVYVLWRAYETPPTPFYVGKGHWQRIIKHEMPSERGNNRHKDNILAKHMRLGTSPLYSIVGSFESETEALELEKQLVGLIGRHDCGNGTLANKTDGGDGTLGHLALKGGDSASARSVVAAGVRYSCLKDAAEAEEIEPGTISGRIKNGWHGYFYEDEGQRTRKKGVVERYRKEVIVEGTRYASASDASRALGIDVRMISKRISYGWPDYYYPDQGQLPRRTIWTSRKDKVGVLVRGIIFDTIAQASRETGESVSMISTRALSSNYDEYYRLDGVELQRSEPPRDRTPVSVDGIFFESATSAGAAFGITHGGATFRCRSSNYPGWRFFDDIKQAQEEHQAAFSSLPKQVEIDGVHFESQSEAARVHGIDLNTLKKRCRSMSFPTWYADGVEKNAPADGRPGLISITVDGNTYRSVAQASRELDISRAEVRRRADSPDWPNYQVWSNMGDQ